MRLTNTMREAFVRAAMQDVPSIDYKEQARALMNKKIAAAIKAAGLAKVDPSRLESMTVYGPSSTNRYALSVYARGLTPDEKKEISSDPVVKQLLDQDEAQSEALEALKTKLSGAISACTTRKQAAEALPEFAKYLPTDEPKALRSLPALANVAADFVKAGWPKTPAKPHRSAQPA